MGLTSHPHRHGDHDSGDGRHLALGRNREDYRVFISFCRHLGHVRELRHLLLGRDDVHLSGGARLSRMRQAHQDDWQDGSLHVLQNHFNDGRPLRWSRAKQRGINYKFLKEPEPMWIPVLCALGTLLEGILDDIPNIQRFKAATPGSDPCQIQLLH